MSSPPVVSGYREEEIQVGDACLVTLRGGSGRPLLVLHDELGFPGWCEWNRQIATRRELVIPLQPGFGRSERIDWIRDYRDLAAFYGRMVRELGLAPVDVIGFSAGGYIAAEMAAANREQLGKLVLVAPLGIKPDEGEIFDFLAVTMRSHLRATVADTSTPEFGAIYGGEMTPRQFELFEEARAETARLGWEPFMHSPSLPQRLEAVPERPTLIVWGSSDRVLPRSAVERYERSLRGSRLVEIPGVGHRPEIEALDEFVKRVEDFLGD